MTLDDQVTGGAGGHRPPLQGHPTSTLPSGHKKALREGRADKRQVRGSYWTFVARLNLLVNFSTRPAVSTMRFSPV